MLQIRDRKMKLLEFILWSTLSLSVGSTEIFEKIDNHEGIVVIKQDVIYSSSDLIRMRMDISLVPWKSHDTALQEEALNVAPWAQRPPEELRRLSKELIQVSNLLDVGTWVHMFQRRKQPLLSLAPSETLSDSVDTSKLGYSPETKTYGIRSGCESIAATLTSKANWRAVIRNSINAANISTTVKVDAPQPSASPAGQTGRKRRQVEVLGPQLKDFNDLLHGDQLAINSMEEVLLAVSEGRFPEKCVSLPQWEALVLAIAPQLSRAEQIRYQKDLQTYVFRFPLTAYRLDKESSPDKLRILVLLPAPESLTIFLLRTLRYIPIRKNGKRLQLKVQPSEVFSDMQLKWTTGGDPNQALQERCLPSTSGPTQHWCFGGLNLQPAQSQQCILDALPADEKHPKAECYNEVTSNDTRIVPLPTGNLLISPAGPQNVAISCGRKKFQKTLTEDTKLTLPRGCIGVIGQHVFTANPLSPIVAPPNDWTDWSSTSDHSENELLPHEAINGHGPIITFPDPDWPLQPPVEEVTTSATPGTPVWLDESKDWILRTVEDRNVQIGLGVGSAILFLYCCCAPASWPRLNGLAWCFNALSKTMSSAATNIATTIRTLFTRRRPQRRRQGPNRRGEIFRDPLERAIMMSQL